MVQILVHLVYFLHMDTKSERGWHMLALIFTLVLVVITLSGSIWIMYHLNTNMMPIPIHEIRHMPCWQQTKTPRAATHPENRAAKQPWISWGRSAERRVGNECVSKCRSRWWQYH